MTIRLSPELERRIQERVEAGLSESVEEFVENVVRTALASNEFTGRTEGRKSASALFDEIWNDTPNEALQSLPDDGAEQVDHYIYGVPKRAS
jgi:hypothetical protein